MEDLICIWLRIERDDYCRRYWDVRKRRQRTAKTVLTVNQLRHNRGLSIADDCVSSGPSNNIWLVASSTKSSETITYEVEQLRDVCADEHCFDRCGILACYKLCAHLYNCTCPDPTPLCKHIHEVHSLVFRCVNIPVEEIPDEEQPNDDSAECEMVTTQCDSYQTYEVEIRDRKILQFRASLRELADLMAEDKVSQLLFNTINESIKNFIIQSESILKTDTIPESGQNIIGEETETYASSQKIRKQVLPFLKKKKDRGASKKTLKRPSKQRKKK